MMYMILKLIYSGYFIFIAIYLVHLVSMLIFSKLQFKKKLKRFFTGVFVAAVWPLMICSSSGISTLKKMINKF